MIVRPATAEDIEQIAKLHAASWRRTYRDALSADYLEHHADDDRRRLWQQRLLQPTESQRVMVAYRARRIHGFACIYLKADPEWGTLLDNIHVSTEAQRTGVGTQLVTAVKSICHAECPGLPVHLWVLQSNTNAQSFYRVLGAECVGTDHWNPPGGGNVPRFRVAWPSASSIKTAAQAQH